jgi:hypothetical protein
VLHISWEQSSFLLAYFNNIHSKYLYTQNMMNSYYTLYHHKVLLNADVWGYLTTISIIGGFFYHFFLFLQVDDEESFIWTLIWPFFDVLVDVVEVVFLWENISCNFLYWNWTYFCLILLIVLSNLVLCVLQYMYYLLYVVTLGGTLFVLFLCKQIR